MFKCKCIFPLCVSLYYAQSHVLEAILNPPNYISQENTGKIICKLPAYGLSILWLICDKLTKTKHQLPGAITDFL